VIAQVVPDSAAQRAGLKAGDIVVAINDRPVRDAQDLRNAIGLSSVGSWVTLAILREGTPITLRARLSESKTSSISESKSNVRWVNALR
jgi:serine protease Do/serine protease DegQ